MSYPFIAFIRISQQAALVLQALFSSNAICEDGRNGIRRKKRKEKEKAR